MKTDESSRTVSARAVIAPVGGNDINVLCCSIKFNGQIQLNK